MWQMYSTAGEPEDRLFMTLSEQIGSQHLQLGVYLGIEPSTVQGIIDGCTTAILAPFFILRAWRDGRRKQANPGAMLDELCCALSDIKRDDLTGEVRLGEEGHYCPIHHVSSCLAKAMSSQQNMNPEYVVCLDIPSYIVLTF